MDERVSDELAGHDVGVVELLPGQAVRQTLLEQATGGPAARRGARKLRVDHDLALDRVPHA
jgi:hypothetical protein